MQLQIIEQKIKDLKSKDIKALSIDDIFTFITEIKDILLFTAKLTHNEKMKELAETPQQATYTYICFFRCNDKFTNLLYALTDEEKHEELNTDNKPEYFFNLTYKGLKSLLNKLETNTEYSKEDLQNAILQIKDLIYSDLLNLLKTALELAFIENNFLLKTIFSLNPYAYYTSKEKKGIIRTLKTKETTYFFKFITDVRYYKKLYFKFLQDPHKENFLFYEFAKFNHTSILENLLFFYKEDTPPDFFTNTTKDFISTIYNNGINTKLDFDYKSEENIDFFIADTFNTLETIQDLSNFFNLFFDLHTYIIKKSYNTLNTKNLQNNNQASQIKIAEDSHQLKLNDKSIKNITGAFNNFKDLKKYEDFKKDKALEETQRFNGYLSRLCKTKKEFETLKKDYFELSQHQPGLTRKQKLDYLIPQRENLIFELYPDFETMDFTTKTQFDNFNINTNTNIITSNFNSIELSIDFANALTLTKDNRETKTFFDFLIIQYISNRTIKEKADRRHIEFTIFDYETKKGITNYTQEARTKCKLDDIIDALFKADIKQNATKTEKGETHFITDRINILTREKTDTNFNAKTKKYDVFLSEELATLIDDIIDGKQGMGHHISYISKNLIDLDKGIGNNGILQKAKAIGLWLDELKRNNENNPKKQNLFFENTFIYPFATMQDVINELITRRLFNKNYKKSFKRLCVDVLQDALNKLAINNIADYETEAFDEYNREPDEAEKKARRVIAIKQNNFLQSKITFIYKNAYKSNTAKQVFEKTKRIKKRIDKTCKN